MAASTGNKFRFVHVPCELDQEMRELELEVPEGKEVECLTSHLQDFYRNYKGGGQVSREHIKEMMQSQLKDAKNSDGSKVDVDKVDTKLLDMMAQMQTVDIVYLIPHVKETDHVAINMYVDDKGIAKNLPVNDRASEIARVAGEPTTVRGDAFIARCFDDENNFKRLDFTLSECSSSAEWVKQARAWRALKQERERNQYCGHPDCTKPGTQRCSKCKKVRYCSKECQRTDWKRHKTTCD